MLQDSGVDLLAICAPSPHKYVLSLMDALFSDEEMSEKCFIASKRSSKLPLPRDKIKLIEGILK